MFAFSLLSTEYEPIYAGWLSLLPPLLTMVLAISTNEVIMSLLIGILCACTIYVVKTHRGVIQILQVFFSMLSSRLSMNMYVCIFLFLMGSLVQLMAKTGGSKAFSAWSVKLVKGRLSAMVVTAMLGLSLFLDDYFNIITTSAVMGIILDHHFVSKPKAAYMIHTVASNMCILVPVSSWAAVIISQIEECGFEDGFGILLHSIPLNNYSIISILFVLFGIFSGVNIGGMKKYEENAINGLSATDGSIMISREATSEEDMKNGKVIDLLLPVITLIVTYISFMFYLGGGFSEKKSILQIFSDADTAEAFTLASFVSLLISFLLYVPRKLLTFKEFIDESKQGMKSMVDTFLILLFAWTIGGVDGNLLLTGEYIGDLITKSALPYCLIPAVVFLLGAVLTFSLGTTWAGFSVLIPIVCNICKQTDLRLTTPCISACLCGCVYGDNISPICDDTVLVSTYVKCHFMAHVKTEAVYASICACLSLIGYVIAGQTFGKAVLSTGIPVLIEFGLFFILWIIKKIQSKKKQVQTDESNLKEELILESEENVIEINES